MRKVFFLSLFWMFASSAMAQNIPLLLVVDFSGPKVLSIKPELIWRESETRMCCDIYEMRIGNMRDLIPDSSLLLNISNRIVINQAPGTTHFHPTSSRTFELIYKKPWESEKMFIPTKKPPRNNWDY